MGWPEEIWASCLSSLLSGKALDVYSRLSDEAANDYETLKDALLKRYDLTEDGYRQKFREAEPESDENPDQYITRLKNYLEKWIEMAQVEESKDGVCELMIREQFLASCPQELAVYLKLNTPGTLQGFAKTAEDYLTAHRKKLGVREGKRPRKPSAQGTQELEHRAEPVRAPEGGSSHSGIQCRLCKRFGHKAFQCNGLRKDPMPKKCFKCSGLGHFAKNCPQKPEEKVGAARITPVKAVKAAAVKGADCVADPDDSSLVEVREGQQVTDLEDFIKAVMLAYVTRWEIRTHCSKWLCATCSDARFRRNCQ